MPYEYLEDVAVADIALRAWGRDLEDTFTSAAEATINVMVENLDSIRPLERRESKLRNEALDILLFDFLQELIYYKDAEKLILRVEKIRIGRDNSEFFLEAFLAGETLDPGRHHMRADVKAVTFHRFRLEKTNGGWEALLILDI